MGDFLAAEQATSEPEQDWTTQNQHSGGRCSESSAPLEADLSLSKTRQGCSIEEWERYFGFFPKSGMYVNGKLYEGRTLEHRHVENEYLSLPTLTSSGQGKNRPAGTTKFEETCKQLGLHTDSQKLSAEAMAQLHGFPTDWTTSALE